MFSKAKECLKRWTTTDINPNRNLQSKSYNNKHDLDTKHDNPMIGLDTKPNYVEIKREDILEDDLKVKKGY